MYITLTPEQEKKILNNPTSIEAIQKYASVIADKLPAYVEPKVLTAVEKLYTPCSCHICEAERLVKVAEYEKVNLKVVNK